jgi:hypothetical protein
MAPKFHDVFTLLPPLLFKSRPAVTAPLSGRTVKLNVDESFSLGNEIDVTHCDTVTPKVF